MANISLGQDGNVYASRAIGGNGQYMPDSSTVLNKSNASTSDTWGAAALAALNGSSEGFVINPTQDFSVTFVGNTGTGNIEEYDPVAAAWVNRVSITDAVEHVIRAPLGPFRIGCATATGTTSVKMRTRGV